MVDYLEHPMIRSRTIQARIYQQILFGTAIKHNALIVLPTGLGKTVIFIMVIAHHLKNYPEHSVIITAPTRPLVNQHLASASKMLNVDYDNIQIISGETTPEQRSDLWQQNKIFICTPQTLRNDIISKRVDLTQISLVCFDEAHRAIGEDPYVLCAQEYQKINPGGRRLGFTASPGTKEKIFEILDNLRLDHFEYMDEEHPQVKPYVHDVEENWIKVELPEEFKKIISLLENNIKEYLQYLKDLDAVKSIVISNNSKTKLLQLPKILNRKRSELSDDEFFGGMARYGQLMLLYQAVEMLETQGIHTLLKYLEDKIDEYRRTNKSSLRRFTQNPDVQTVITLTRQLVESDIDHPKLTKLKELVEDTLKSNPDSRILVFSNYKATTQHLVSNLSDLSGISVHRFVGQSSSSYGKGLSQKEQKQVMADFKSGIYNVLVSTSVGEEGLDVAQCDLVIFYDVTPSATRLIQRSGRTGRAREGRVVILITKDTRDEGYFYASRRQKQKIKNSIQGIKTELNNRKDQKQQTSLDSYFDDENKAGENSFSSSPEITEPVDFSSSDSSVIYIDHRERGTSIVRKLLNTPVELKLTSLPVGDFILSDRVAVERKTTRDFVNTLTRGELFDQLIELKTTYLKPMLLLEGGNLYATAMHKNAIRGAISSILVDYNIPILYAQDEDESIELLLSIASREQKEKSREPVIRAQKSTESIIEEQLFLISSLPNINNILAERILRHFKSPEAFFKASIEELKQIHGIGTQIATNIREVLTKASFSD